MLQRPPPPLNMPCVGGGRRGIRDTLVVPVGAHALRSASSRPSCPHPTPLPCFPPNVPTKGLASQCCARRLAARLPPTPRPCPLPPSPAPAAGMSDRMADSTKLPKLCFPPDDLPAHGGWEGDLTSPTGVLVSPLGLLLTTPPAPATRGGSLTAARVAALAAAAPTTPPVTPSQDRNPRKVPALRREGPPRRSPRGVALSRVTVLRAWGEGVPPTAATFSGYSAPSTAVEERGDGRRPRVPPPPPLTLGSGVGAGVDGEIDALEGAGWWVAPPSPSLLVCPASADASADAGLCF